jgi:CBS domain containing-hemolysin-like protein
LPVYEGTLDRIVGIVATKDLLPYLHRGDGDGIFARDVVRPAYYVPETKPIASTLEELRRQRTLLAVVVDSDGGTAGLVTLEDLLEELVGEIQDEYDVEEPPLRVVEESSGQRVVLCEAGSTVRDLGRFLQREFHIDPVLRDGDSQRADASQSLAALALDLFESVPKTGDKIVAGDAVANTTDIRASFGLVLEIAHMEGPRIEEVRIRLMAQDNA